MATRRPSPADHGRSETRERPEVTRALRREQRALAVRLRALRTDRNMSQEAAAEAIGLSPKHLRRLELGQSNVTLATLVAFSLAYRVRVGQLLGG